MSTDKTFYGQVLGMSFTARFITFQMNIDKDFNVSDALLIVEGIKFAAPDFGHASDDNPTESQTVLLVH